MADPSVRNHSSMNQYLADAADVARTVFAQHEKSVLDEQAGPAYLEGFFLSRWVFWKRLKKIIRLLPERGDACIDFGCGFGLLLPLLRRRFASVAGIDVMPGTAGQFLSEWDRRFEQDHEDVSIVETLDVTNLADGSVDLILALDVLEHVDDLDKILEQMSRLLKPDGVLLVSGPTENWWYRLGRRIVGFSGDYHVRDIDDIQSEMENCFDVELVGRVFYPLTLFNLLSGVPRSGEDK